MLFPHFRNNQECMILVTISLLLLYVLSIISAYQQSGILFWYSPIVEILTLIKHTSLLPPRGNNVPKMFYHAGHSMCCKNIPRKYDQE